MHLDAIGISSYYKTYISSRIIHAETAGPTGNKAHGKINPRRPHRPAGIQGNTNMTHHQRAKAPEKRKAKEMIKKCPADANRSSR